MSKEFSKAQAQITADKIAMIFQFVGMLDATDLEYLKKVSEDMEAQSSQLRAVQGVMVDYDRAENKLQWNAQARARISGLLMIHEAMKNTPEPSNAREHDAQKEDIAKMFGL